MTIRRSVLPLALPLLLSSSAFGSEPGKFDRTLAVSGPVSLDVKSGPGGIHISVGSTDAVVVHAVIRSAFGRVDLGLAEANIRSLEQNPPVEQSGNTIRIGYVNDVAVLKGVSVTYDIETPRATQVHASADAGGIRIDGVQGPVVTDNDAGHSEVSGVKGSLKMTAHSGGIVARDIGDDILVRNASGGIQVQSAGKAVDAETSSGRIEISEVAGDVRSTTHSASIRLNHVNGTVNARNTSGSIEAFLLGGSITAETTSGAIRISQSSPAAIRALSGSGAIRVELASGNGYNLDAQSTKGKISGKVAEPFLQSKDQHGVKGVVGAGGPLVDLDSRSSKIEVN